MTTYRARNFVASLALVQADTANTNFAVVHGLVDSQENGITPRGYIPIRRLSNAQLYDGTGTTDGSVISLRATAAGASFLVIFYA